MNDLQSPAEIRLTPEKLQAAVFKRLEKYNGLNVLEYFAMLMGVAQLLELSLKGLLHRKYGMDPESMEQWTLGMTARAIQDRGLRRDFCLHLAEVVKYRNHIAHELLAQKFMLKALSDGRDTGRLVVGELESGTYALEELIVVYEWLEEHDAWGLAFHRSDLAASRS